ncbi:LMBR1 domain-containing protein 2-like protein [Smittium mucronatum]|uniref:LMBR1 domain-containing protein 2-like protein n=1 Tax=Smittium mucronatum TaxID=133383 RepID=A0A1R0H6P1_9FUNG|nr:LMBR1 domain-containing protein 2-like protein [Smittium mucronatum]
MALPTHSALYRLTSDWGIYPFHQFNPHLKQVFLVPLNSAPSISSPPPPVSLDVFSNIPVVFCCFSGFSLESNYRECLGPNCQKPRGYMELSTTLFLWRFLYWTLFFLTWVVLPIYSEYVESGHLSRKLKLKQAIRDHVKLKLTVGVFLLLALFVIAAKGYLNMHNFTAFAMVAANSWGIILIVSFMGVGLVKIPRDFYNSSSPSKLLRHIEKNAPSLLNAAEDSELDLIEVLYQFWSIPNRDDTYSSYYPFFKKIEIENSDLFKKYRYRLETYGNPIQSVQNIDENYLASLRKKINLSNLKFEANVYQWEKAKLSAFFYQDLVSAKFTGILSSSVEPIRSWPLWKRSLAYTWYIVIAPYVYMLISSILILLSISILQSEAMVTIYPKWTIIGSLFHYIKNNSYLIEFFSITILSYMSISVFSSVTKVKFFGMDNLYPNRNSSQKSLLACGSQLCRLMMPLCYNFLGIASLDLTTAFHKLMGKVDSVPVFGQGFNRAMPVIVLLPAVLTYFRIFDKIMRVFSFDLVEDRSTPGSSSSSVYSGIGISEFNEGKTLLLNCKYLFIPICIFSSLFFFMYSSHLLFF